MKDVPMDPKTLPGSIKVAILIQAAGKVSSEKILSMMNGGERRVIENHLAQMGEISPDVVEKVSQEFLQLAGKTEPRRIGGPPLPQEAETTEESSGGSDRESSDLSVLKSLKPDHLLELIKDEHPWLWVDLLSKHNWPMTVDLVKDLLKTDNGRNFSSRIFIWRHSKTKEQLQYAFGVWKNLLGEFYKNSLAKILNKK